MSQGRNHKIAKKIGEILGNAEQPIIPQSKEGQIKRNYEEISYQETDLTQLQNCLSIFHPREKRFYKLADIDYRGLRYQTSGESITRWFNFDMVELIIFTQKDVFEAKYAEYKAKREADNERVKPIEKIFAWLAQDFSRLTAKMIDGTAF